MQETSDQRRRPGLRRLLFAGLFLAACLWGLWSVCGASGAGRTAERVRGGGLFSWHLSAPEREWVFDRMEELGLCELYQHFPADCGGDAARELVSAAKDRGMDVYWLTGEPDWGLDGSGRAMEEEIARAAALPGLRGVVMDAEPYLTEQWEENPERVMESYVKAMTAARKAAEQAGLELVACIPYFYDDLGLTEQLADLVRGGCHALAVMNYYRGEEAAHLREEAALAAAWERPLITVYELQAPGSHDLTERNTYYEEGLDALYANWEEVRRTYPDVRISCALHDDRALKEVLDR